jgi:hypothetical protein
MDKVPLETFQRDFLLTHLKNKTKCVLEQLELRCQRSSEPFEALLAGLVKACWKDQTAYWCDHWYSHEIPLNKCYFAHEDFRGYRVPKDGRFTDFLDKHIYEIESHSFPMAREIRAKWEPVPRPMVEERDPDNWTLRVTDVTENPKNVGRERYYVLDGQLRVIRHWYHQRLSVPVFIFRGPDGKV